MLRRKKWKMKTEKKVGDFRRTRVVDHKESEEKEEDELRNSNINFAGVLVVKKQWCLVFTPKCRYLVDKTVSLG